MYSPWKRNNIVWKLSGDGRKQDACLRVLNQLHSEAIAKCKQVEYNDAEERPPKLSVLDKLWAVAEMGKVITYDQVQSELSTFIFGVICIYIVTLIIELLKCCFRAMKLLVQL